MEKKSIIPSKKTHDVIKDKRQMNVWDLKNGAGLCNDNVTWDDPANTFFRMLQ